MSDLYANAIDSLRIGIEHYLKDPSYSSRKHAILTLFHAIELFLKERLSRINPLFIYKNIESEITDDSLTVGVRDALARLRNLGLGMPPEQQRVIETIQKRRNRIEHHRYDHQEEDDKIIAESLSFILLFTELELRAKLEEDIQADTLREIQRIAFPYDQRYWIAMHRLETWMHERWPEWDESVSDSPEDFVGTTDCPICRNEWLLIGHHDKPFCFHCNTSVDAGECDRCGRSFLVGQPCCVDEVDV